MSTIRIRLTRGKRTEVVEVNPKATVEEVKHQVSKTIRLAPERVRLFLGEGKTAVVLSDEKTLADYPDVKHDSAVNYKDLGPQIGWRTVFLLEYLGPLVIYPLFVVPQLRHIIYGSNSAAWPASPVQQWALACWSFHYLKRELETLFVHKFSHGTMPLFNLWKNSAYYWGCTAAVSYFVNHPLYTHSLSLQSAQAALAAFVLFELLNLVTHVQLSNLRPTGSRKYGLPKGLWWDFITCPNYTFEVLSWAAFSVMTQTLTAGLFTLLGFVQMFVWAQGKHKRYCKEFPSGPVRKSDEVFNKRKALMFPPFL